jgi:hypothetical protein
MAKRRRRCGDQQTKRAVDLIDGVKGIPPPAVELAERIRRLQAEWFPLDPEPLPPTDRLDAALARQMGYGPQHRKPVKKAQAEKTRKPWSGKPPTKTVEAAMDEIAESYGKLPLDAPRPAFADIWDDLKARCGDVTRGQARAALQNRAPYLQGRRGYRRARKSSV